MKGKFENEGMWVQGRAVENKGKLMKKEEEKSKDKISMAQ